ncbi:MAG: adenine-specific DNA-methyltransferase [Fimbriimonadaceae bacterium]
MRVPHSDDSSALDALSSKAAFTRVATVESSVSAYLGSCFDVLPQIEDASIDLVFADPPYNIGKQFGEFRDTWPSEEAYANWCYDWLELCIRKLKPTGSLYVMTSTQAASYLDLWLRKHVTIRSRLVWHYDSSGVQAKKYFGSLYEPILFCVKDPNSYTFNSNDIQVEARTGAVRRLIDYRKSIPSHYNSTKVPGNVWYIPRVRYRMPEYEEHPAQKPEALLERIIRASTNVGDLVLDPFAGTFTTCAVARRLRRRSVGIELQRKYFKAGLRRLGLATHFDGELLKPLKKGFAPRHCLPLLSTEEGRDKMSGASNAEV